mmetsp:Transcript_65521/g.176359  ORF Transcript_65521/g.176359 Transcript_65521/m.176359 type:complete len:244 (+) Transcript_65521:847-1578(+)
MPCRVRHPSQKSFQPDILAFSAPLPADATSVAALLAVPLAAAPAAAGDPEEAAPPEGALGSAETVAVAAAALRGVASAAMPSAQLGSSRTSTATRPDMPKALSPATHKPPRQPARLRPKPTKSGAMAPPKLFEVFQTDQNVPLSSGRHQLSRTRAQEGLPRPCQRPLHVQTTPSTVTRPPTSLKSGGAHAAKQLKAPVRARPITKQTDGDLSAETTLAPILLKPTAIWPMLVSMPTVLKSSPS